MQLLLNLLPQGDLFMRTPSSDQRARSPRSLDLRAGLSQLLFSSLALSVFACEELLDTPAPAAATAELQSYCIYEGTPLVQFQLQRVVAESYDIELQSEGERLALGLGWSGVRGLISTEMSAAAHRVSWLGGCEAEPCEDPCAALPTPPKEGAAGCRLFDGSSPEMLTLRLLAWPSRGKGEVITTEATLRVSERCEETGSLDLGVGVVDLGLDQSVDQERE